ncbi:MAG: 2-dehydro-3-deoxygalactonokinase [Verrucomicrobiales bacterium]|nr:2-dehydro-3-deoxygalactonokinase [Verrucomicrobiales bacterium]
MMTKGSLIAVDWGSTHLRVKLIIEGRVAESRSSDQGIKRLKSKGFDSVLFSLCGDWKKQHPDFPIWMSGMIGSREGWKEVPYCPTPVCLKDLVAALSVVETESLGEVFIVPGLRHDFDDDATDVMRGEEVEVFGLLAGLDNEKLEGSPLTICGPGTHSKWVNVEGGQIVSFRTWFTGEAFEKLTQDSLISGGSLVDRDQVNRGGFTRGLESSGRSGGLLHHLFLGRTDMLTQRVEAAHLPALISGLLIGHEIREARKFAQGEVYLMGNNRSAELYTQAFDYFDMPHTRCHEDVHMAGMLALLNSGLNNSKHSFQTASK